MAKKYRPWTPNQSWLFPPSPRDWLDKEHFVFFLMEVVDELDIGAIEDSIHAKDARGNRPFDPRMLTALLLYGYCTGVRSSRKLEKATWEDVATRVLVGEQHPDHSVIARFRRRHITALEGLFLQVLKLCSRHGLTKLGHVALDGTKVQANASKHKAMSHARMKKEEERLRAEIEAMLADAEAVDREEDAQYGSDKRGDELPEELRRRVGRRERIRQAMAEIEAEAAQGRVEAVEARERRHEETAQEADADATEQEAAGRPEQAQQSRQARRKAKRLAEKARKQADAARKHLQEKKKAARYEPASAPDSLTDLPRHLAPWDAKGNPKPRAQRNFTDPESRIMVSGGNYLQAYNGQAAVDSGHQIIVAADLSNTPPDTWQLQPMVQQTIDAMGEPPTVFTADNGYYADDNAIFCAERGIEAYISTGKHPAATEERQAMTTRLQSEAGKAAYKRRKAIVEPVFGQIKEILGFRRFSLRGLDLARGEWRLICTAHNLLKLWRYGAAAA